MMPQFDAAQQTANVEITVNPLVNWVWLGFGVLAIGTVIALLPEAAFAFAVARVPVGERGDRVVAAAGDRVCLQPCRRRTATPPATAREQDDAAASTRRANHLHVRLCGLRAQSARELPDAPGLPRHTMRRVAQLQQFIDEGKRPGRRSSRRSSRSTAAARPRRPERYGFNRLAWLLPYRARGAGRSLVIVVTARRWSRRNQPQPARAAATSQSTPRSTPAWTMSSETSTEPQPSASSPGSCSRWPA